MHLHLAKTNTASTGQTFKVLLYSLCLAVGTILPCQGPAIAQEPSEEGAEPEAGQSPAPRPPLRPTRRAQMERLALAQSHESVQWLTLGSSDFLALYQPAFKQEATGTVLMLHDAEQHPDWPGTLSDLRHYLPDMGWSTLAIALPNPDTPKPPTAIPAKPRVNAQSSTANEDGTDSEVSANESETDDIFDDEANTVGDGVEIPSEEESELDVPPGKAEEVSIDRIIAAIDFLQQNSEGPVVLYGQGLGATRAGEYLQEVGPTGTISALVFIDAQNQLQLSDFNMVEALNDPNLPVLDLVSLETALAISDVDMRKKNARTIEAKKYRQMQIAPEGRSSEPTLKRIYGFLHKELE